MGLRAAESFEAPEFAEQLMARRPIDPVQAVLASAPEEQVHLAFADPASTIDLEPFAMRRRKPITSARP